MYKICIQMHKSALKCTNVPSDFFWGSWKRVGHIVGVVKGGGMGCRVLQSVDSDIAILVYTNVAIDIGVHNDCRYRHSYTQRLRMSLSTFTYTNSHIHSGMHAAPIHASYHTRNCDISHTQEWVISHMKIQNVMLINRPCQKCNWVI